MDILEREITLSNQTEITLGQEYTDQLTGLSGKAVAAHTYLFGPDSVTLSRVVENKEQHWTVEADRLTPATSGF